MQQLLILYVYLFSSSIYIITENLYNNLMYIQAQGNS